MELSKEKFDEAVRLKREGDYAAALEIYRAALKKMESINDFREFSLYAHAMAKCFYLQQDFRHAQVCYDAVLAQNLAVYPQIIMDFINKDDKFQEFAINWGIHIGYVQHGWDQSYAGAIAGRGNGYDQGRFLREGLSYIFSFVMDVTHRAILDSHPDKMYADKLFRSNFKKLVNF